MGEFLTPAQEFFTIEEDQENQLVTVKLHGKGIVPRSRLRGSQIKTKEQQRIKTNQFLIAEIDAKFGGFGIVPAELDGAIVSGHYFLYDINSQKLSPQFLECYISSGILTQRIQKYIQGALNYSAIRPHHILEVSFPLPDDVDAGTQEDVISKFTQIRRIQIQAQKQLEAAYALERAMMRQYFDFNEDLIAWAPRR
jgi:type I restriction enzyme S subunit